MASKYLVYSFSVLVFYLFYEPSGGAASWKRWRRLWSGWIIIPTGIGISVLTVLQWRRIASNRQSGNKTVINDFQIVCYRAVPFRALSRVWGWISSCYVPTHLRCWLYTRFAEMCGVNVEEAADSLECYNSLCEFFVRPLKEGVRPIAEMEPLVSPADGRVISAGYVNSCRVEQIKGVTYAIKSFLGEPTWWRPDCNSPFNLDAIMMDNESATLEELMHPPATSINVTGDVSSTGGDAVNGGGICNAMRTKPSYCKSAIASCSSEYDMLQLDLTSAILYKDVNAMVRYNNWMLGWLIFYFRFCITVLLKNSFYIGFQLIYGIKTTNNLMNHKVLSGASFLKSHFNINLSSSSLLYSFSSSSSSSNNNNNKTENNGDAMTNAATGNNRYDSDFESSNDDDDDDQSDSSKSNNCSEPIVACDAEWEEYKKKLLHNEDNKLFQLVVYLAPGDYHRFHSPVDWHVSFRRHFQGDLLSVHPKISKWIPELFSLNERVVYVGEWKHGFFSMIAVGATNVGSIRVHTDQTLQTNTRKWKGGIRHRDHPLNNTWKKGQEIGEFRLGSTIVLLFEAPKDFNLTVQAGDRIKVGEPVVAVPQ